MQSLPTDRANGGPEWPWGIQAVGRLSAEDPRQPGRRELGETFNCLVGEGVPASPRAMGRPAAGWPPLRSHGVPASVHAPLAWAPESSPPVQILGTHLPLFKMLNHLPHTHHQPLSRPGTSHPSAPQIYPIPLRISPWLWFRPTALSSGGPAGASSAMMPPSPVGPRGSPAGETQWRPPLPES